MSNVWIVGLIASSVYNTRALNAIIFYTFLLIIPSALISNYEFFILSWAKPFSKKRFYVCTNEKNSFAFELLILTVFSRVKHFLDKICNFFWKMSWKDEACVHKLCIPHMIDANIEKEYHIWSNMYIKIYNNHVIKIILRFLVLQH